MRHAYSRLTSALLTVAFALTPLLSVSPAHASGSFNPNQLISDIVFTSRNAMSVGEIQAFLQKNGSVLASIGPEHLGANANGRSAAQIIWDAARASISDYGPASRPSNPFTVSLNPQVILVTLQKEQSLILRNLTPGSSETNSRLRAAMGMGCPDSAPCDSEYYGFANQVTMGAATLWLQYWRASNSPYYSNTDPARRVGDTINFTATLPSVCGSDSRFSNVTISNAATASLYRYTTGCNGHYNFWYYMNQWFSDVLYQPTAIVRETDGQLFVIDGSGRWYISSADLTAWGLQSMSTTAITTEQRALPIQGTFSRLTLDSEGTVFFMENGRKRPLTSARLMDRARLSWSEVQRISQTIVDKIPYGLPMHELVLPEGDGTIYLATNGQLYPISAAAFRAWGFRMNEVGRVPAYTVSTLPEGGLLSRYAMPMNGDGTVFFIDNGYGYKLSAQSVRDWNLDISTTRTVGVPLLDELGNGGILTNLAKAPGDGTVYLMQNGVKRPISASAWRKNGYRGTDVRTVSTELLNQYSTGSILR